MLVEKLLEAGDIAIGLRPRHRWNEMVDQGGMRPAFGLGTLAGVIYQERVDQRQVAQGGVGRAG